MNKWIGIIRPTKDAEIRYTADGKAIAKFDGACNRRFKKEGERDADFFRFIAFGYNAAFCEKYVKKGVKFIVEAHVQNYEYEEDGVRHYGNDWIIDSMEFAESKGSGSGASSEAPIGAAGVGSDGFINIAQGVEEELPFS